MYSVCNGVNKSFLRRGKTVRINCLRRKLEMITSEFLNFNNRMFTSRKRLKSLICPRVQQKIFRYTKIALSITTFKNLDLMFEQVVPILQFKV